MSEEEKKVEETKEEDKSKTVETLDRADEIVSRRERVVTREEELQTRKEQFAAREVVGGTAEAGKTTEKEEETPAEYAKKVMEGEQ